MPVISLIVAVADNGIIGREGWMPWRLSADLKRFKALTLGHHLLMGRLTWESIGRALPGRTTLVLSRREGYEAAGAVVVGSLEEGLRAAGGAEEVFIAGGGEIYRLALPVVERIYLTRVHAEPEGDTVFEGPDPAHWVRVAAESHPADERNEAPSTFEIWRRRTSGDR